MKQVPRRRNPGTPQILKRTTIVLGLALAGMQLVPATMKTAKGAADTLPVHMTEVIDPQVGRILDRSCGDCHSNDTHWPWYSRVAPVSWILSSHVKKGRQKLDFSKWASERHSANELTEVCDAVSDGSMPLRSYTWFHPGAKLSDQDVEVICRWTENANHAVDSGRPQSAAEHNQQQLFAWKGDR
jgi:heme-binding protein